ncbi:MAG: hypothetical protein H6701_16630 [Myxococcales bacterium]|nr:hypothetical protein [Myxococcales bacterium]
MVEPMTGASAAPTADEKCGGTHGEMLQQSMAIARRLDRSLALYYPGFESRFLPTMVERLALLAEVQETGAEELRNANEAFAENRSRAGSIELTRAAEHIKQSALLIRQTAMFALVMCHADAVPDRASSEQRLAALLAEIGVDGRGVLGLEVGVHYAFVPDPDGETLSLISAPGVWQRLRITIEEGTRMLRALTERSRQPREPANARVTPRIETPEAPPEPEGPRPQERGAWYIGFSIGGGVNGVMFGDRSVTYAEHAERALGGDDDTGLDLAMNLQIGGTLTPHVLLGFEGAFMARSGEETGYRLQHNQYLLAASVFPMQDGQGFFLKGGVGLSILVIEYDTFRQTETSSNGVGLMGGLGYALWLGDSFNLTLSNDFHYGRYGGGGESEPASAWFDMLALGFAWY